MKKFGLAAKQSPKPKPKTLREVEEEIEAGINPAFVGDEASSKGEEGQKAAGRRGSVKSEGGGGAATSGGKSNSSSDKRRREEGDGKKEVPWKTQPGTPGKRR